MVTQLKALDDLQAASFGYTEISVDVRFFEELLQLESKLTLKGSLKVVGGC